MAHSRILAWLLGLKPWYHVAAWQWEGTPPLRHRSSLTEAATAIPPAAEEVLTHLLPTPIF